VILSGSNNWHGLAGGLAIVLTWQLPNQLASSANITMNGATRLNRAARCSPRRARPGAPNTQTINNLTINNDGGTNTVDGPTIFTGAGALTIAARSRPVPPRLARSRHQRLHRPDRRQRPGGTSSIVVTRKPTSRTIVLALNANIVAPTASP